MPNLKAPTQPFVKFLKMHLLLHAVLFADKISTSQDKISEEKKIRPRKASKNRKHNAKQTSRETTNFLLKVGFAWLPLITCSVILDSVR